MGLHMGPEQPAMTLKLQWPRAEDFLFTKHRNIGSFNSFSIDTYTHPSCCVALTQGMRGWDEYRVWFKTLPIASFNK